MMKWNNLFGLFVPSKTPEKPLKKGKEILFWDPTGQKTSSNHFLKDRAEMEASFKKYQDNPHLPSRNFYLMCIPMLLLILGSVWQQQFLFDEVLATDGGFRFYALVAFGCFALPAGYRAIIKTLQRDYIKSLLAQKHQWLYNPEENFVHWSVLSPKFPEIFQKGTKDQNMQDEFWGTVKNSQGVVPFYSAVFEYTVVTGSGKNRREKTYHNTIFAFQLPVKVKAPFLLVPEFAGMGFFKWLGGKEIETESGEFNKAFAFSYNGKKDEKALEIVKTLSPAVQTKLLDLRKAEPRFSFLFKEKVAIFSTNGKLLPKMKTNFFRKVEIDPRDEETLKERMHTILDIVGEMGKYLS